MPAAGVPGSNLHAGTDRSNLDRDALTCTQRVTSLPSLDASNKRAWREEAERGWKKVGGKVGSLPARELEHPSAFGPRVIGATQDCQNSAHDHRRKADERWKTKRPNDEDGYNPRPNEAGPTAREFRACFFESRDLLQERFSLFLIRRFSLDHRRLWTVPIGFFFFVVFFVFPLPLD